MVASVAMGELNLAPRDVISALTAPETAPPYVAMIVNDLRLPRAIMALLVGAALAVAGTATQAIMRNPLAEPGLIGINSGAALMAVIVIVETGTLPDRLMPVLSFAGALGMSVLIYALAWREGTSSLRIILIGIGLGALAGAAATFVSLMGDVAAAQRAMTWLAGSLQDSRWPKVVTLAAWSVLPFAVLWGLARELDLFRMGDEVGQGLGQNVDLMRGVIILACAALAGAAVAATGPVAFVGLAAPHIARKIVGASHRLLIPAAALTGAILVLLADIAARRLLAPVQLPVGVMTAILGAPFFGWLLWTRRNE
nr:iron ABC transporter permease [Pseudoruegeria sp. HB172150]